MGIKRFSTTYIGEQGIAPRIVKITTTDSLATVTALNYAHTMITEGFPFNKTDVIFMNYGTNSATFGIFTPTITSAGTQFFSYVNPGSVSTTGTLVNGDLATYSGTTGTLTDPGYRIIANTTATFAGGGTTNAFVATGLTANSKGSCVIRQSTNAVEIAKAFPTANTLSVTFSADPGTGTTVDYIYTTAVAS